MKKKCYKIQWHTSFKHLVSHHIISIFYFYLIYHATFSILLGITAMRKILFSIARSSEMNCNLIGNFCGKVEKWYLKYILHNACQFNLKVDFQNWSLQLTLKIIWPFAQN